ncbi:hypothetical protein MTBLM5_400012 [Magnetospirillum sp. LM-5]|uniref:pPIWI-associating nuclease domain-containing protein n=1 Tax=Magnetospirillum sp. LM-5 TaxID=2681466 RepID=UPI00137CBAF7|nr:hypothetical protein [Magnetospirillum sp. LM-5]CAA7621732.1 hypothetical protein MTBLM5_400012 [Magnetospirillum sp. LM-5]
MAQNKINGAEIARAVYGTALLNCFPTVLNELDQLSNRTEFDGVDVIDESIQTSDEKFEADVIVYVGLSYGGRNDEITTSDNLPGHIKGRLTEDGQIVIDDLTVDTSSFYE